MSRKTRSQDSNSNIPDIPEWKRRALADPSLRERQVEILLRGPKSLTDAWFLQAMKYKYNRG